MGHWGVKSYENDDAADALDAALQAVHGARYEELMDDANPTPHERVQESLVSPETLAAAAGALAEFFGPDPETWDETERLAFAGVVVRHAECGVPVPTDWRDRARDWLEAEAIEWDDATLRRLRRQKEIALLQPRTEP